VDCSIFINSRLNAQYLASYRLMVKRSRLSFLVFWSTYVPYRRKKLTFAISSPDEFLLILLANAASLWTEFELPYDRKCVGLASFVGRCNCKAGGCTPVCIATEINRNSVFYACKKISGYVVFSRKADQHCRLQGVVNNVNKLPLLHTKMQQGLF